MTSRADTINKALAFAWLVTIGTNVAAYHSYIIPAQGPLILAGAAWFSWVNRKRLARLFLSLDYALAFSLLAVPVVLMLLYRFTGWMTVGSIERSGTFFASVALVFVASSLIALPLDYRRTIVQAAFAIVTIAALLNLYELFAGNVWSGTPGRAAGFYGNPNVSSEALIGYGMVVLLGRAGKLTLADFAVMALVALGVFATFSRSGILLAAVFLAGAVAVRTEPRHLVRVLFLAGGAALLTVSFAWFVVQHLDLSSDAALRIVSLIERGGIGDYQEDRGKVAMAALDMGLEYPLLGAGLGTIFEMPVGPHNMFVAMFVDFGLVGLAIYVTVLIRMMMVARLAPRDWSALLWALAAWHIGFSLVSHNLLTDAEKIPLLGIALARASQIRGLRRAGLISR